MPHLAASSERVVTMTPLPPLDERRERHSNAMKKKRTSQNTCSTLSMVSLDEKQNDINNNHDHSKNPGRFFWDERDPRYLVTYLSQDTVLDNNDGERGGTTTYKNKNGNDRKDQMTNITSDLSAGSSLTAPFPSSLPVDVWKDISLVDKDGFEFEEEDPPRCSRIKTANPNNNNGTHPGCCCCCCNSKSGGSNPKEEEEVSTITDEIPKMMRLKAILWLIFLTMIYIFMTVTFSDLLRDDKMESQDRHANQLDPDAAESGKTNSEVDDINETEAVEYVEIGVYLDRVTEFSIIDNGWTADFYIWFRWTNGDSWEDEDNGTDTTNEYTWEEVYGNSTNSSANSTDRRLEGQSVSGRSGQSVTTTNGGSSSGSGKPGKTGTYSGGSAIVAGAVVATTVAKAQDEISFPRLDPGETFQIIDGELLDKEELERQVKPIPDDEDDFGYNNTNATRTKYLHYTLYRVQARTTKFFNIMRFPRDDHLLSLRIEDTVRDHHHLMFVADEQGSAVSSRVAINGYALEQLTVLQKLHAYKSARGDPWADPTIQINFSQFIGGIPVVRPNWGLYLMMFQGVFAAVGVSFIGLCIKNESRYDLGIGGFFAVVAATYVSSTLLPMVGVFSLADYINGVSLFTVLLTLLHVFMERHIFKDSDQRWFEQIGLAVFVFGYCICISTMSQAASVVY